MIKLTKESAFSANNRLIKQIDGCPMGGPISVVFSDIYMCKMEEDVVKPLKPIFYKRYVDDTYVKRKRNESDTLFDALNSYHPNIKFTLEQNPKRFLDTQIIKENNRIKTQVLSKNLCIQFTGPRKCHSVTRRMQLMVNCTEPRQFPEIFNQS